MHMGSRRADGVGRRAGGAGGYRSLRVGVAGGRVHIAEGLGHGVHVVRRRVVAHCVGERQSHLRGVGCRV